MPLPFCRYELRSTDADAAREFYARLLGHDRAVVWPLHEQARARGAMPHWLGSVGVEDLPELERVAEELVRRGATMLGPVRPAGDGRHSAVLRDPGGAILGLTTRRDPEPAPAVDVSWHVLNTNDLAAAAANYRSLFGWSIRETPLAGPHGAFLELRWSDSQEESAGAMSDIGDRPGVHPHWLFLFRVTSLDAAIERTRAAGGTAMDPIAGASGARMAICEDPQRAAFGLMEGSAGRS